MDSLIVGLFYLCLVNAQIEMAAVWQAVFTFNR